MKLLDRIALNRLVSIITGFILAITKIIMSHSEVEDIDEPVPPKRRIPWLKRKKKS
jgi:hypothetical protein